MWKLNLLALTAVLMLAGCSDSSDLNGTANAAPGLSKNIKNGVAHIQRFGCGACHVVPGIRGANGLVGPPLNQIARRVYLGGVLRNTPENMAAWVQNPQKFVPGNAMPNMGIKDDEARDIAAYLYTLK